MLIGLLDNAQWKNPKFDELMSKLPRGRADLFNLALGHVSRSFLLWAYMGMTVKSNSTTSVLATSDLNKLSQSIVELIPLAELFYIVANVPSTESQSKISSVTYIGSYRQEYARELNDRVIVGPIEESCRAPLIFQKLINTR
jgi:hypothetical protein